MKSGTTKTIGCPTFAGVISQSMLLIAFLFALMILAWANQWNIWSNDQSIFFFQQIQSNFNQISSKFQKSKG